jgi:hypothetical protein
MTKRLLLTLAVLVTIQVTDSPKAWSQDGAAVPDTGGGVRHRVFYRDKWWWVGRAVSAAAIIVDGASTMAALRECPGCAEDAFLFPSAHPSAGGTAARGLVGFAISTAASIGEYEVMRDVPRHNGWALASYLADPITQGVIHGWAAAHNYSLADECRRAVVVCR